MMTTEQMVTLGFSGACVGLVIAGLMWVILYQGRTLLERDLMIRQLVDRIQSFRIAQGDPLVGRALGCSPPSVREERVDAATRGGAAATAFGGFGDTAVAPKTDEAPPEKVVAFHPCG